MEAAHKKWTLATWRFIIQNSEFYETLEYLGKGFVCSKNNLS